MSKKIELRKNPNGDNWLIGCGICSGVFPVFAAYLSPWAVAKTHTAGLLLLRWHIAMHRAQKCQHCGAEPPAIPRPKAIEDMPGRFTVGDKLYQIGQLTIDEVPIGDPR